ILWLHEQVKIFRDAAYARVLLQSKSSSDGIGYAVLVHSLQDLAIKALCLRRKRRRRRGGERGAFRRFGSLLNHEGVWMFFSGRRLQGSGCRRRLYSCKRNALYETGIF